MLRILGIDPGSRATGYGVIECDSNQVSYLAGGAIRLADDNLCRRLLRIFEGISNVIHRYRPDVAAVEKVFVSINPQSALKIGHARGSAICACAANDVAIEEYSVREIKQSVTGTGSADKDQVKYMMQMLLGLDEIDTQDEADALAVAITHYQHVPLQNAVRGSHYRELPSDPIVSAIQ